MDQRSIALDLAMKGFSAMDIHRDLTEILGSNAVSYSTVTRFIRMMSCTDVTDVDEIHGGPKSINETDEAILKALSDESFSSVRELARHTCLSKTTIHRHLTLSLGFTVRHLRWMPHHLSNDQKSKRVELSKQLLSILEKQQTRGWYDIITLDESWFYFSTDHEMIWLAPGGTIPEKEKHMIQSPQLMKTVAWNTSGFQVIEALPKCTHFNASYYSTQILEQINE
jgi:hypothetical protein